MPNIPAGLEPFMLSASYGHTALLAVAIWWASGLAGLPGGRRVVAWLVALAVLVSWQFLGQTLARAGVFVSRADQLRPWMGVAVVTPVILGLAAIAASPTARRIVEATPLWALVALQTYRVLGGVFLVLWAGGHIPGVFALPAGIGDVATGLAAPFVAFALARSPDRQHHVAWWNAFGILDLMIAIATGFLSSPGLMQALALDAPNRLIAAFPMALVPLYGVPVALILHGLVWQRLAARGAATIAHSPAG